MAPDGSQMDPDVSQMAPDGSQMAPDEKYMVYARFAIVSEGPGGIPDGSQMDS